jgi:NAD+ synthase (glutamine-hydrolysing)
MLFVTFTVALCQRAGDGEGVEIVTNGSGSHHQLRKLDQRLELMKAATAKAGGVYLYANQQGCDGGRVYYDGCSAVMVNGKLVAQASQFSLKVSTSSMSLPSVLDASCTCNTALS